MSEPLSNRQQEILRAEAITGADDLQHPKGAWGELQEDYPTPPPRDDIKCSTIDEVSEFYDHGRPEDIKIL